MIESVQFARPDGSYVATFRGLPYHVTKEDPLFEDVQAWVKKNGKPGAEPPPPPLPVPIPALSLRQLWTGAALAGHITKNEAKAAMRQGQVPQKIAAELAKMPENDAFVAEGLLTSATSVERGHPLTAKIAQLWSLDDAQTDDFFRFAASL